MIPSGQVRRWLILTSTLTSLVSCPSAESAPAGNEVEPRYFSSRSPDDVGSTSESLYPKPPLVFRPLAAVHPPGQAGNSVSRMGPFDPRRYGFAWVAVVLSRDLPLDRSDQAPLTLDLVAEGGRGQRAWRLDVSGARDSEMLDFGALHGTWEGVAAGTPSPGRPTFVVRWAQVIQGANATAYVSNELLVEMSSGEPVVAALLERSLNEGGGVCTVWGNGHQNSIDCVWHQADQDFVCTEDRLFPEATWGRKRVSRRFMLRSGRQLVPPGAHPVAVSALSGPTRQALRRAPIFLAGLGPAKLLGEVGGGRALLATGGQGAGLDARFFLLLAGPRAAQALREVPLRRLDDPLPAPEPAITAFERTELPQLDARLFHREPGLEIWQVLVREQERGTHYLLGIEGGPDGVAQALELATDAGVQADCGSVMLPSTVLALAGRQVPFAVDVEVQPPFTEGHVAAEDPSPSFNFRSQEGEADEACTERGRILWKRGGGFDVSREPQVPCDSPQLPVYPEIGFDAPLRRQVRAAPPARPGNP